MPEIIRDGCELTYTVDGPPEAPVLAPIYPRRGASILMPHTCPTSKPPDPLRRRCSNFLAREPHMNDEPGRGRRRRC
jgi:hypothetical protein